MNQDFLSVFWAYYSTSYKHTLGFRWLQWESPINNNIEMTENIVMIMIAHSFIHFSCNHSSLKLFLNSALFWIIYLLHIMLSTLVAQKHEKLDHEYSFPSSLLIVMV